MNPALSPLLMLPFLLVACVQPTTAELEAKLCGDLEAFGASLTELSQINAQSSVNQLRQARENVAQSFQAVKDSAKAVEASRLDDLTAAYDNFDKTVNSISGRDTVGEAASQVAASFADVQAAREQLDASLNCQ